MWFWWFILISDLLIPLIMIIGGLVMWKHCPKNINTLYGYRSVRSMKNMDTWKFAHDYCGRLWLKIGLIILIPSVLIHIPFYNSSEDALGAVCFAAMTIQCIALVMAIFKTESALKKAFNDDGSRI